MDDFNSRLDTSRRATFYPGPERWTDKYKSPPHLDQGMNPGGGGWESQFEEDENWNVSARNNVLEDFRPPQKRIDPAFYLDGLNQGSRVLDSETALFLYKKPLPPTQEEFYGPSEVYDARNKAQKRYVDNLAARTKFSALNERLIHGTEDFVYPTDNQDAVMATGMVTVRGKEFNKAMGKIIPRAPIQSKYSGKASTNPKREQAKALIYTNPAKALEGRGKVHLKNQPPGAIDPRRLELDGQKQKSNTIVSKATFLDKSNRVVKGRKEYMADKTKDPQIREKQGRPSRIIRNGLDEDVTRYLTEKDGRPEKIKKLKTDVRRRTIGKTQKGGISDEKFELKDDPKFKVGRKLAARSSNKQRGVLGGDKQDASEIKVGEVRKTMETYRAGNSIKGFVERLVKPATNDQFLKFRKTTEEETVPSKRSAIRLRRAIDTHMSIGADEQSIEEILSPRPDLGVVLDRHNAGEDPRFK